MAVKKQQIKNVIVSYPETISKIPLVIFIGGILSVEYATKESIEKQVQDSLKNKAIFVFKDHKVESINNCIEIGKKIAKENLIGISDIKVLGFSGGAEDITLEISDKFSYIGLIDPSVPDNIGNYKPVASRVRMTYNSDEWSSQKLKNNQILFSKQIKDNGGQADLTNIKHKDAVSKFLQSFEEEIAKPIDDPKNNTIRDTKNQSLLQKTTQTTETPAPATAQFTNSMQPLNVNQFENKQNYATIDKIGPTLDRKTTTLYGVVSLAASKLLFKNDSLEGIEFFKGQVLRVTKVEMSSKKSETIPLLNSLFGNTVFVCKVRIPEINSFLPIPSSFDGTELDKNIINQYHDFIYDPMFHIFQSIDPGDIVNITYENLSNFTGGRILNVFGKTSNLLNNFTPLTSNIGSLFNNKSLSSATSENLPDIKKIIENEDKSQEISEVIKNIPSETTLIVKLKNGKTVARKGNRNWRNNNPGNIRYGDFTKDSGAIGTDGSFAVFPTFEKGINSLFKLLKGKSYFNKSLFDAMSAYAPPSENDTAGYIAKIEKTVGVSSQTKISELSSVQFETFVSTILKVEGYIAGDIKEINIS